MNVLLPAALLLAIVTARADVPPPNRSTCNDNNVGSTCTMDDGSAGTCQKQTCSGLDYSHGTPPSSRTYECVLCGSGAAPAPTPTPAPAPTPAPTPTATPTPAPAPAPSQTRCATTEGTASSMALLLGAVALVTRRKR